MQQQIKVNEPEINVVDFNIKTIITDKKSYHDFIVIWRLKYRQISEKSRWLKNCIATCARNDMIAHVVLSQRDLKRVSSLARTMMEERTQARMLADHLIMNRHRKEQSAKDKATKTA